LQTGLSQLLQVQTQRRFNFPALIFKNSGSQVSIDIPVDSDCFLLEVPVKFLDQGKTVKYDSLQASLAAIFAKHLPRDGDYKLPADRRKDVKFAAGQALKKTAEPKEQKGQTEQEKRFSSPDTCLSTFSATGPKTGNF
jgi:hypothetical protein